MNELALFAGVGGGLLASKWLLGWRTVCYIENDTYCVKVLQARIADGYLDDAPIWDDVRTFNGEPWRGVVDIVSGGFPCQPFSAAGQRRGEGDERNLWPDTIRVIREVWPEWVFLENVSGLLSYDYFGEILGDLAASGFDIAWDCLPASAVGANHQRDRVWIVAHAHGARIFSKQECEWEDQTHLGWDGQEKSVANTKRSGWKRNPGSRVDTIVPAKKSKDVPDADCGGLEIGAELDGESQEDTADGSPLRGHPDGLCDNVPDAESVGRIARGSGNAEEIMRGRQSNRGRLGDTDWWEVEPDVGRVADGVASRVERLRAIGNGQVPPVAAVAWRLLRARLMETVS